MAFAKKPANLCKFKLKMTTSTSCKGHNFLTKSPTDKRSFAKRSWIIKLRFTNNHLSNDFTRKKLWPLDFVFGFFRLSIFWLYARRFSIGHLRKSD